jgi:hypothetical protein
MAGKGIGEAAKGALAIPGGQQQVQFEGQKSELVKIIAAALGQAHVNSEQIQDLVDSNTPSYWDSEETYNGKVQRIRDFIKQNTHTDRLENWGLTK